LEGLFETFSRDVADSGKIPIYLLKCQWFRGDPQNRGFGCKLDIGGEKSDDRRIVKTNASCNLVLLF
jgi:hypothetical protein